MMSIYYFIPVVVWLVGITAFLVYIFFSYKTLARSVKKGDFIKLLDKVLNLQRQNLKKTKDLEKLYKIMEEDGLLHTQKVGLVRFNPFEEMGGDQSFALALLNGKDDGIIITGLHTRERTRVYLREIKTGKSKYVLSKEEKRALQIATGRDKK